MTKRAQEQPKTIAANPELQVGPHRGGSPDELMDFAKRLRSTVPRMSHGVWKKPADRADLIAQIQASDHERLPELLPVRYGRMLISPFTFYRGAAGVMAADIATTPGRPV